MSPKNRHGDSSRRDFLKKVGATLFGSTLQTAITVGVGGTLLTGAAILSYNLLTQDDGAQAPVQYGPVTIGVKKEIIDKKYQGATAHLDIDKPERVKNLPFLVAVLNGLPEITEAFFQSSEKGFNQIIRIDPSLEKYRQQFLKDFPDKFTMSDNVKRYMVSALTQTAAARKMNEDTFFEECSVLVKHGADPIMLLTDPKLGMEDFKLLVGAMPPDGDPAHLPLLHAMLNRLRSAPDGWDKIGYAIEHGIDVNQHPAKEIKQDTGTALHFLIANEEFDEAIRLMRLMRDKFDPGVKDSEGKNAFVIAAKVMSTEVVKKLLAWNKNNPKLKEILNEKDNDGRTALHYAAAYALPEMVDALLKAGASKDIPDNKGRTAAKYVNLPPPEVGDMLRSIEISPDRNIRATWNAFITSDFVPFGDRDGKAVLATTKNMKENYESMKQAIEKRAGTDDNRRLKDMAMLNKQKANVEIENISVMESIIKRRQETSKLLSGPGVGR